MPDKCHYRPTERWVDHPGGDGVRGRAWVYQPPTANQPHAVDVRVPRVLVTGSQDWTDTATIRAALTDQWGDGSAVLVSGAVPARRRSDRRDDLVHPWRGRRP